MTENIRNPQAHTLFTIATEDESALQYPLPDRIFGFLTQQSCEKLLKSLLCAHNVQYPHTHSLETLQKKLRNDCSEVLPNLPSKLTALQPFAAELRYEDDGTLPPLDRAAMRETVAILRAYTLSRILALQTL